MKKCIAIFALFGLIACNKRVYLHKIDGYLNASTIEQKSAYMSVNFHSFFGQKSAGGKDKQAALTSFMNWDGPLHPDIKILHYSRQHNVWTVFFLEQNDFSKLIRFPGWKGSSQITFDIHEMILESIYFPDTTNPNYKSYLAPAVLWLKENIPDKLNEVYKDGKLIQNEKSARMWVELLTSWRKSTDK